MPIASDNQLGTYLKDRRAKLDPAAFGFPLTRRRTPGLRREEVASRASVSATWYTWLEQGRGGAPSADVLERIARALMLMEIEREHLFLLALGRPPEVRYQAAEGVTPRLQRVLDALELSPAYVKTSTWDIVAWNRAATARGDAKLGQRRPLCGGRVPGRRSTSRGCDERQGAGR
jgi:transcriptional regulator with XRE-family HTH domain